uniref:PB1 domain-containing protein n=1 Tax=Amphimedon queenslandica TaxID=400682 RepID=A0A1X7T5M6_AMPQE
MAQEKVVLLSYMDRNRLVKIPEEKEGSDLSFLEKDFRKEFSYQGNIHIKITFQRFNEDWKEYIDLDNDEHVFSMEKLKVIVSPILKTPATTNNSPVNQTPKRRRILQDYDSDESLPSLPPIVVDTPHMVTPHMETPPIETPPMETSSIIDGTSSASPGVSSSIKKKITKTDDDKIPLPDPFPLPKRYRPEVEKALKAKQMSNKTRSDFLSSVASAILSFKLYPTREDYNCVARSIVKEYPFLKAPPGAGSPHGAIVTQLMNRFKEFRRDKKSRDTSKPSTTKQVQQKLSGITSAIPPIKEQPGEDNFSFQQHQKRLKAEYQKRQPNLDVVNDLMERSFSMRRNDILVKGYTGVAELFDTYPFLQDFFQ